MQDKPDICINIAKSASKWRQLSQFKAMRLGLQAALHLFYVDRVCAVSFKIKLIKIPHALLLHKQALLFDRQVYFRSGGDAEDEGSEHNISEHCSEMAKQLWP